MVKRLIKSACVWYVYFPHLAMMRLIGPGGAMLVARVVAHAHWLLTFVGAQRRTRRILARALPAIRPTLSVHTAVRRYLVDKHQRFIEWYLYPTRRGRRLAERSYDHLEGREHIDAALARERGVIVLVFHFGVAKMVWPALKAHGYDNYHHVFRGTTYAGETTDSVAAAAMKALARTEEASGLKVIYHRPGFTFETMARLLRRNAVVGMNGDGMMGEGFVELPFLGGTMRFPTGPARLAACSGAPIVSAYGLVEGLTKRRLVLHPPIYCREDSPEAVNACTGACVAVLDEYVRRYPWSWWTWRRLEATEVGGGRVRFAARALTADEGQYHAPSPPAAREAAMVSSR